MCRSSARALLHDQTAFCSVRGEIWHLTEGTAGNRADEVLQVASSAQAIECCHNTHFTTSILVQRDVKLAYAVCRSRCGVTTRHQSVH